MTEARVSCSLTHRLDPPHVSKPCPGFGKHPRVKHMFLSEAEIHISPSSITQLWQDYAALMCSFFKHFSAQNKPCGKQMAHSPL